MRQNHSLKPYNTFNVAACCDFFCEIDDVPTTQILLNSLPYKKLPKLVLGGGSNILFTENFKGLIIKNNIRGIKLVLEDDDHVWLTVGAGENWHQFVLYCIQNDYAGVENLSLIPGTMGAAPIQNIGAYGIEFESVLDSLQALQLTSGEIKTFSRQDCELGYRDSIFKRTLKNQYLITHVTVKLNKKPSPHIAYGDINTILQQKNIKSPTIADVSQAVMTIRQQKLPDPKTLPNAGSFFKNPVISNEQFQKIQKKFPDIPHFEQPHHTTKIPAAWLIDTCGLKGFKKNGVGISPHHALVIVNYDGAQGKIIKEFSESIQQRVDEKFQIKLEAEVNIF